MYGNYVCITAKLMSKDSFSAFSSIRLRNLTLLYVPNSICIPIHHESNRRNMISIWVLAHYVTNVHICSTWFYSLHKFISSLFIEFFHNIQIFSGRRTKVYRIFHRFIATFFCYSRIHYLYHNAVSVALTMCNVKQHCSEKDAVSRFYRNQFRLCKYEQDYSTESLLFMLMAILCSNINVSQIKSVRVLVVAPNWFYYAHWNERQHVYQSTFKNKWVRISGWKFIFTHSFYVWPV